jgi:uncharacterized protein
LDKLTEQVIKFGLSYYWLMAAIGRVARLRRYPVKSMRGEELSVAAVNEYGLVGDREYAFTVDNSPNPKIPWMTARQANEMLLYKPRILSPSNVEVESPDGSRFTISDAELERLLEEKYGYQLSLRRSEGGCQDAKPLSIMGLQSVQKLAEEAGIDNLAPERFRANIYADWKSGGAFFEDQLVGKEIKLGDEVILRVVKKDSRCVIPTLDPDTSAASPAVLEKIQSLHAGCIGVYAETVKAGEIRVEDEISLI